MFGAEVALGELAQIVAVGAQMVVNHIEDHCDPEPVRLINKPAKVVRRAVEPCRGEQVHSVVAPAEAACEIGHWHHLKDRDSKVSQRGQFPNRCLPRTLGRESADMHLI